MSCQFLFVTVVQKTHSKFISIAERLPACASNWISFTTVIIRVHFANSKVFCIKECFIYFDPIVVNYLEYFSWESILPSHIMLLCQILGKSQVSIDATVQLSKTPINTLACSTQLFVTVVFESQQCISYEYLNVRAELSDIFNYMLPNFVLLANFLRENNCGDLSYKYCWIK